MTDATGSACWEADYYPYGQEKTPASFSDTCSTHYKFTGYERDPETDPGNGTGNDYAFARYYSPRLGRFMSADPSGGDLSDPQTLNKYAYTRNNPINMIDPTGMDGSCPYSTKDVQNYCLGNTPSGGNSGGGTGGSGGGGDVSGYSNWGGGILVWLPGSCNITGPCNMAPTIMFPAPPPPTPAEQKKKSTTPPPQDPDDARIRAFAAEMNKRPTGKFIAAAYGGSVGAAALGTAAPEAVELVNEFPDAAQNIFDFVTTVAIDGPPTSATPSWGEMVGNVVNLIIQVMGK